MKHRLTILYSDGSSKTVEGARNMETHLSTVLPSADGSSSYSLLTSTCVALQDRVLNISDIRFNVVDDLDRVIDELTRELNSNSNRLQMPEIPKCSKPDRVASDKDCAAEILKYETELDRLRGKLFDSAQFNESTVSKYSKYSTVDIETVQSQISDLRSSLYSDSEVQYSTDTDMLRDAIAAQSHMLLRCPTGPIDCTVEQVTAQLEALNLGTTLTDKSESELQSIIDEYNKTVQTDEEEQRHDEEIPLGLRSKPYSTVQPVLPSTLVLEQLPVKNSRYSSMKIEKIDGELSKISSKLSIVSKLLEQYTQYCVQYNIPIPPGKVDSIERPPLKKDLVRVEYCKKPATVPDSRLKLESIAKNEAMSSVSIEKELNEYTEYCNMHSIVVPRPVDYSEGATVTEQRHPSHCSVTCAPALKEDLVRVEYVSKPSTDREYSAEELNDMRETRARLYDELVEYEQYCTVHSIPIPTAKVSRVDRPVLKENLQRVEYRSKPKISLAALSSHIQSLSKLPLFSHMHSLSTLSLFSHTHSFSTADDEEVLLQHIEQLETTIAKSCRVDPALLCTDCRARVQCMTDTEYEQYVDALDKCRLMLEYSRYLKYEEYSKYVSTVGNYTAYLRQRLQTIDYSIKEAEQYMNWLNYSRYEQYVQSVGKYTAYLRVQYDTVQQYEQYIKYEEYSKYVSTVGKYTAYLRTIVGKYEECIEELQARKNNYIYEQCHDYYWYLNRRRILRSEIDKYRHDLSVIRDRRKKKQLETKLRVLKGQHNCTVRRKIKELESLVDGRLCYDRCLHNSTVLKEIETVEDILHCLDQWQLYYMKIKQYDEWRQSYDIKRRYLTVLEEVRDSQLEYCRSTVEAVCNEMLHNIYGSSKRIVISRDTESKRSSNRYRIVLEDNGRIVRRMAHSIKFILDILVRCALIRFNSNLPNFMIIDEGFGALDIENAVQFWSELKAEMSRYLDYTIVIDHGVAHDDEQVDVMCISTSVTGSTLKY